MRDDGGEIVVEVKRTKGRENEKNVDELTISRNPDMYSGLNAHTREKVLPHFARYWER